MASMSTNGNLTARGTGLDDSMELQNQNVQANPHVYEKNNRPGLTGEYIAGLVQADGSFSAVLCRKTRNNKEYFNLSLVFTLVQSQKHKDLILDIQKI